MPQYPTPPGNRFDLGFDGTDVLVKLDSEADAAFQVLPQAQVAAMCGLAFTSHAQKTLAASAVMRVRVIFPEPRQILGTRWTGYSDYGSSYSLGCRYSLDATAAAWNGTWVNLAVHGGQGRNYGSQDSFRTAVAAQAIDNVLGMEFWVRNDRGSGPYTGRIGDLHIYGARSVAGDHLAFWHPTLDQPLPAGSFDFGDIIRGTAQPGRPFRIKNTSATKTAVGVVLSYGDLDGGGLTGDAGQVSADNATWFPNLNIGDLAPGGVSPVRHLRVSSTLARAMAYAAAGRLRATPTSWTG